MAAALGTACGHQLYDWSAQHGVLKLNSTKAGFISNLRHAELVEALASVGLAVSRHKFELAVERIVLGGLRGDALPQRQLQRTVLGPQISYARC